MGNIQKINNIRAFAIITVVFGHSIILYSSQWGLYEPNSPCLILDYIKRFINLYQMPLFFSISGYLFAFRCRQRKTGQFIANKIRRLIIPFFIIGMLWMIPIKLLLHYPNYEGQSYLGAFHMLLDGKDLGHLWYLPTLFFLFLIMYFVINAFGNTQQVWGIVLTITIVLNIFSPRIPTGGIVYLSYIYQYAWSFMIGAVIYKVKIENFPQRKIWIIAPFSIAISAFYVYIGKTNTLMASIAILLSTYLFMTNKCYNSLDLLSKYSFGIYLFHSPLIYITYTYLLNVNPAIVILTNFIVFGGISFIITYLIKKTPAKFIIGE